MHSKVIIKSKLHHPPEEEVNLAIRDYVNGWRVVQATTNVFVFEDTTEPNIRLRHQCSFVTTVVLEKV